MADAPFTDPRPRKDDSWAKKIEIAKQARQAGQAVRKSPVASEPKLRTK